MQSVDYQPPTSATTPYSAAGMIIDLNNKNIRMPNTAILSDGSLYTKSGEIGGFTIDGTRLYSPVTIGTKTYRANIQSMGNETDPARLAFYVAIDENGSSTYPFRVNYAGTLFTSDVQATGGKIGPWTISISAIYNGKTALEYDNGSGVYIGSDGIGTSDGTYGNLSLSANGTLTLKNISADRNYAKISIQGGPGSETNPSKTEISYTGLYVKNKTYSFSQLDLGQNNTTGGYVDVTGFRMNTGIHMRGDNYGVGYPVISLLAHGDTSSYTATNGGLIEFCFNSSSATSKIQETSAGVLTMTASLNLTGNLVATTGIGVNKTTQQEAKAGFWANSAGNLYLTGDTNTGSYIYFYYNKATSATSYIREESSNHLYTNAYFRPKLYNGTVGQVVGSVPTDGNQIAYFSSNSTTLFINGQHGTTGSTFANKSIAFSTSDIRLKTNIEDAGIEALPIVNRMKVRAFDWKDGRKDIHQSIGVVADELEEIDRRLSVGGGYAEDGSINYKSVDTLYLCGYLLKAIQELSAEVKALKGVA